MTDERKKSRLMRMRVGGAVVLALSMAITGWAGVSPEAGRQTLDFNPGWRFFRMDDASASDAAFSAAAFDDTGWERVSVPHSVRLEPENGSGCRNFQGVCWYRRHFTLSPQWAGRRLELTFEGAMQKTEVWLNGVKLMTHVGGYLPFVADLSGRVRFGTDNVLALRLDNRDDRLIPPGCPQAKLDFTYDGGLYRNVRLTIKEDLHITDPLLANQVAGGGVFVTYPLVSKTGAVVRVRTEVRNTSDRERRFVVVQELSDAKGRSAASAASFVTTLAGGSRVTLDQRLSVASPALWHPDHPSLYTLRTRIEENGKTTDGQTTRIGIRSIRFDTATGLWINGEHFFSMGANRHQDYVYVGNALPDSGQWRDARLLRGAGFTSFRSHYPQAPAFMDACDALGILCIVSTPGWHNYADEPVFRERAWSDVRAMIRRDRNHPSAFLWEIGLNESRYTREYAEGAYRAAHEEYPGEACFTSGDGYEPWQKSDPVFDVVYTAWDGRKPGWVREAGDADDMNWQDQFARNRIMRGWGEMAQLTQAQSHLRCIGWRYAKRDVCGGWCLWAGIDHDRGYHPLPFLGGVLDRRRLPKFSYWAFASQRPPEVRLEGCESGPMVRIAHEMTHFSPRDVTVFSNCEAVRLLRNGREVGVIRPTFVPNGPLHPAVVFANAWDGDTGSYDKTVKPMRWVWSELKAEGLIGDRVVATHTVRPPGIPRAVTLTAEDGGRPLTADGADFMPLRIALTDDKSGLAPLVDLPVSVTVEGPGGVIGDAAVGANPVRTAFGETTVLIRAGVTPGELRVRASAEGLASGELTLTSHSSPMSFVPGRDVAPLSDEKQSALSENRGPVSSRETALAMPAEEQMETQEASQAIRDRQ